MRPLHALTLFVSLPWALPGQSGAPPASTELAALETAVRDHLTARRAERHFPGASAAFVLPDGRVGKAVVGFEDEAEQSALTVQHKFLSGSIGKTYCAAVALQLVGEGKLQLDGKVHDVLGDRAWYARLPNAGTITLRHLLTHQSGIPDHVWQDGFEARVLGEPDRPPDPTECVGFVLDKTPLAPPGTKWGYADTNFVLVGLMIEAVSGEPFYRQLRKRVLEPLQLRDTLPCDRRNLDLLCNGERSGIAFGRGPTVADGRYFVDPSFEYCGGGLCSTAGDLARWGRALFAGEVLPAALRAEFVQPLPAEKRITEGYGLGCFVMESKLGRALGHSGFMPGYQAMLAHYVEQKLTVAILWNTDDGKQVGNPRRAAEALAGLLHERLAPEPAAK